MSDDGYCIASTCPGKKHIKTQDSRQVYLVTNVLLAVSSCFWEESQVDSVNELAAVVGDLASDAVSNPFMSDWNHVSIAYCSSDSFMGDMAAGNSIF